MTRRSFSISKISEIAGEGVLDIPSLSILRFKEPKKLLEEFKELWGVSATMVALPAVESNGLLYEVEGLQGIPISPYAQPSQRFKGFEDVVAAFLSEGLDITLTLYPGYSLLPGEGILLRDITGSTAAQPCIANPRAQEMLGAILGTGIDIIQEVAARNRGGRLVGVALDVTDLWPSSGELGRVEATCFCAVCTRYFEKTTPDLIKHFKTFPNPWSLLLRPTETGISYYDEIPLNSSAEDIVGFARQRNFIAQFPNVDQPQLLENANILLRYMRGRHALTVGAVGALFDYACEGLNEKLARILIMEGDMYGWTSGLWLEELDATPTDQSGIDELWFNVTPSYVPRNIPYRAYMWRRSRYLISNYFDFVGVLSSSTRASTALRYKSVEECRLEVAERWATVYSAALSAQAALQTLPSGSDETGADVRRGFVGVGLTREFGEKFSDQLSILPMRSTNTRSSTPEISGLQLQRLLEMLMPDDDD